MSEPHKRDWLGVFGVLSFLAACAHYGHECADRYSATVQPQADLPLDNAKEDLLPK